MQASSTPSALSSVSDSMSSAFQAAGNRGQDVRGEVTAPTSAAPSEEPQAVPGPSNGIMASENGQALLRHIYNTGFRNGEWHDCILHFKTSTGSQQAFRLHTLIIVRSPLLREQLLNSTNREIQLAVSNPHITDEAVSICLQYLYGATSAAAISASNATAVFATAHWLGLEDVTQEAYTVVKSSLNASNVRGVLAFAQAREDKPAADDGAQPNGHATPPTSSAASTTSATASSAGALRYGEYSEDLLRVTSEYLSKTLPVEVGAFADPPKPGGVEALTAAYSTLDFELFSAIAQASPLPARPQDRFAFLKKCVAARKKALGTSLNGEEQVVMAFAGPGGGQVQVLRKPHRRLAKVGPHAR